MLAVSQSRKRWIKGHLRADRGVAICRQRGVSNGSQIHGTQLDAARVVIIRVFLCRNMHNTPTMRCTDGTARHSARTTRFDERRLVPCLVVGRVLRREEEALHVCTCPCSLVSPPTFGRLT